MSPVVERPMTTHDKRLYSAWLDGFEQGYEHGREHNWPVKWILRSMYWEWRARRQRRRPR